MDELQGIGLFDSIRAAPPHPKPEAVAVVVRLDVVPLDSGDWPALGKGHNMLSDVLHSHRVCKRVSRSLSPDPQPDATVLINRHRCKSTPVFARGTHSYVTEQAHTAAFGAEIL